MTPLAAPDPAAQLRLEEIAHEAEVVRLRAKLKATPGLKFSDRVFFAHQINVADRAWRAAHKGQLEILRRRGQL